MALRSTVYRAEITLSDLDRHVYLTRALTLARHPSETEERLMVRLLAWAILVGEFGGAEERLQFGPGLSSEDEPDLVARDDTGAISLWVDVGLPDERALRKAAGRADAVVLLAYGARKLDAWWSENASALARIGNLRVLALDGEASESLAALAARSMQLSCTLQDGHLWLGSGERSVEITPRWLQGGP
jgi:uncharacterized protein YaeQ